MIYTITLNPSIDYIVQMDQLEVGKINRIQTDHKFPGGKGINVSRVLQRLGHKNIALGFLGGFTGNFIGDSLAAEEILNHFTTIKEDTRINVKIRATNETELNGAGPTLSDSEISDLKNKLNQVTAQDLVILSGSIPPSLPPTFYNELIEIIHERQAEFVIDTTGAALLDALPFKPLLIKPNNDELGEIFQQEFSSIEEMIPYGQTLLEKGAQHVLVSLGKRGALLFARNEIYFAEPLQGELKNSVGAGDSMIAGFVSQISQNPSDYLTAFRYGVAAGSGTAFSDDLASQALIERLVESVNIQKIN